MNVMRQVLACSTALAMVALPSAARADTGSDPGSAGKRSVTAQTTGPQKKLIFDGATVKGGPKRNNPMYAGAAPIWVQNPVLEKKKGKYGIYASATVRPHRRKGVHAKSSKDRLTAKVAVFPTGTSADETKASYIRKVSITVSKRGLATLRVPVSKKAAKHVRTFQKQRDRILVTLIHAKDTYPSIGTSADFQQVLSGRMTKRVLGKKQTKKLMAKATVIQRRVEQGKTPRKAAGARLANLNQFYYTGLYVYNNTPFQQAVTFNPDIACMAAAYPVDNVTINPMIGTVQIVFGGLSSTLNPNDGQQWYGQTTGNPPNDAPDVNSELVAAGRSSLNQLDAIMSDPETYTKVGLITGVLSLGVNFAIKALEDSLNDGCNSYGQYWGLTATAVQIGTDGQTIVGNPDTWSLGYFQTPGDQTQANGQPIMRWVEVGEQAQLAANNLPTNSTEQAYLSQIMTAAVGQQTQSTYFMNGGMPAPIANAGGNTAWNGSANYAQGLIQFVYPNPGSCANNNCDTAMAGVQLAWLTENWENTPGPQFQAGTGPTATATSVPDSAGGNDMLINCTIAGGLYENPFGGTQGQPASSPSVQMASLTGLPSVTSAGYSVSYYAQDAEGNYLYDSESTSQSTYPGQASSPPSLDSLDGGVQYISATNSTVAPAQLSLTPIDMGRLINPQTGAAGTPVSYGCAVTPVVQFTDMSIASGAYWGGNWPFPQTQTGGPLSSPLNNQVNWANPVDAINLTWSGSTYLSAPVTPAG